MVWESSHTMVQRGKPREEVIMDMNEFVGPVKPPKKVRKVKEPKVPCTDLAGVAYGMEAAGFPEEPVQVEPPAAGYKVPQLIVHSGGRVIDTAALLRKVIRMLEEPRSGVTSYDVNVAVDDLRTMMDHI